MVTDSPQGQPIEPAAPSSAGAPQPVWSVLPGALSILAALVVIGVVCFQWTALGSIRWPLLLAAATSGLAVWFFRREPSQAERNAAARMEEARRERERVANDQQTLKELQTTVMKQLDGKIEQLRQREERLAAQVQSFHQLWEFPPPTTLPSEASTGEQVEPHPADEISQKSPAALATLVAQDQQLEQLLEKETQALFERIRTNYYAPQGKPDPLMMRDDVLRLVTAAARIYQPDAAHPLLETSLDRVLRALHRASLQLMVVLDELPISVKDRSFANIYQYVRQGVKAYATYKQAEPYFPYMNAAYYAGRLAMGANPLTLGAWWFLGALGRESAKAIGTHLLNRQALVVLQSIVRTIGTEVATLYGGDYRHRDRYWVYGTEVTELVAAFPWSRDSLSQALKEIGALPLRSEYDRMFLIRCVGAKKSADPARYHPASWLSVVERRGIAERLEKFVTHYVHGRSPDAVAAWHKGVESRLAVKVQIAGTTSLSVEQQRREAVLALVSFLLSHRAMEVDEALAMVATTTIWKQGTDEERSTNEASLRETPPFVFDPPDLDPDGPFVAPFLDDLASLVAKTKPQSPEITEFYQQTALYLRVAQVKAEATLEKVRRELLLNEKLTPQARQLGTARSPLETSSFEPTAAVVCAMLDMVGEGEKIAFAYDRVTFSPSSPNVGVKLCLIGFPDRLVVVELMGQKPSSDKSPGELPRPQVVWKCETTPRIEWARNFMTRDCRIGGGEWLNATDTPSPVIVVSGPLLGSSENYFRPLTSWRTALPSNP